MNDELRDIIFGTGEITEGNLIQAILYFLRKSQKTSGKTEKSELITKKDEVNYLILFAEKNNLWYKEIKESFYIGEGAEQKVYLNEDGKSVTKINSGIFYLSWIDYFISILIHNYLFPSTSYEFMGFYLKENVFYVVVKQHFVESTETTDLESVKKFLLSNGFKHKKNNDFYNDNLGIILEDLHDENVLSNQGVLFFIDTVIYLK
jgi:hypothetical protein